MRLLLAVLALLATLLASCADRPVDTPPPPATAAPTAPPPIPPADLDLQTADLATLQDAMARGRLTAAALTAWSLERIRTVDPGVHAVLAVDPTARDQATASDARRAAGRTGPLEGVPVMAKGNTSVGPTLPTTAGSLALADSRPPEAEAVRRLREAGAVILGSTTMTAWAGARSSQSASGWSATGATTGNPYDPTRTACGSSSGSAAAVAAALAPVALGTETSGSIVCPAGTNGVVGVKPGVGLVSRSGVVPYSQAQDTVGPLARSVRDAAAVLAVVQGSDASDPSTAEADAHPVTPTVAPRPLAGVRLGVLRDDQGASEETDDAYAAALDRLRGLGAELVDPVRLPNASRARAAANSALTTEIAHDLGAYLRSPGVSGPRSLDELIAFGREQAGREMPFFGQELFEQAAATRGDVTDPRYRAARADPTALSRADLDAALAGVDALVSPTNAPAWPTDLVNGDHFSVSPAGPAATAGYPSTSVPMAMSHGVPLGLSLIGGRWSEGRLLAVAAGVEEGLHARVPPPLPAATVPLTAGR
ncbi:amidase family protein [Actinomycetospora straminea]|uniref:Amidase n=1 Tax=Actinomycetospora straminea TaxID=663607 RepID=A0ABP9DXH1_9PSEU|nr:amidase family protein [Actinomycetospora straminea]MDD7932343.1 amidase family protein [Actinomycetospora straminea]